MSFHTLKTLRFWFCSNTYSTFSKTNRVQTKPTAHGESLPRPPVLCRVEVSTGPTDKARPLSKVQRLHLSLWAPWIWTQTAARQSVEPPAPTPGQIVVPQEAGSLNVRQRTAR